MDLTLFNVDLIIKRIISYCDIAFFSEFVFVVFVEFFRTLTNNLTKIINIHNKCLFFEEDWLFISPYLGSACAYFEAGKNPSFVNSRVP